MSTQPAQPIPRHISPPGPDSPDARQAQASDPGRSVWVAASAGSGKTKVLTDRVLRLLLPQPDGTPGTPPERILCLTFTKVGAAEMAQRIGERMAHWTVLPEDDLRTELAALQGRAGQETDARMIDSARRLFAQVIDQPAGLKILTIHSFCQSILGRFPVEARLPPHFSVADETTTAPLLQAALAGVLRQAQNGERPDLGAALARLSAIRRDEGGLSDMLQTLIDERARLTTMHRHMNAPGRAPDALATAIYGVLGLSPGAQADDLLRGALDDTAIDHAALRRVALAMVADTKAKKMPARGAVIMDMLNAQTADRPTLYARYRRCFLTNEGEILKDLVGKNVQKTDPEATSVMTAEAERLSALDDRLKAAACAQTSADLVCVGTALIESYAAMKAARAVLDYDDLITRTLDLLRGDSMNVSGAEAAAWVRYKLDQGIDHVLVDEAQDTNPEQWEIIHALCDDFFDGDGARADVARTIFAVGDEKQSIFGFQRAAPEKFRAAQALYAERAGRAGRHFDPVDMRVSFRSAAAILALTDAVFDTTEPWKSLGLPDGTRVSHTSHRHGQPGHAEIWPMEIVDNTTEEEGASAEGWEMPVAVSRGQNAQAAIAQKIAMQIRIWIDTPDSSILPAYNRPVRAGDILILVRSRGTLVDHLVRALKSARVPVSGVDRMVLGSQIAVQDMIAAASFALQPADDLALAGLLKSPLVGMDEEQLYTLAVDRAGGETLWAQVRQHGTESVRDWLEGLVARAGAVHPYEFFSHLLHHPCPADTQGSGLRAMTARLGQDAGEPLMEFLGTALHFEQDNPPSLQHFLHWQRENATEVKREQETKSNLVRIMTVHAAKGLQAPIVILPDTVHTDAAIMKIRTKERLLWVPCAEGTAVPLWSPRKDLDCAAYAALLEERKARMAEEYRRLYYVALTRAADRLYIGGYWQGKRGQPSDGCWYALAEQAFRNINADPPADMTVSPRTLTNSALPGVAPDRVRPEDDSRAPVVMPACDDWSWIMRDPPAEEAQPRPWAPSRPATPEPAMASPLAVVDDAYRFRRGNATHALLQFLPGLPRAGWETAARRFLDRQDLTDSVRTDVLHETLAVLENPDFAALFGPGSMAEVPITGLIGGKLVSGQIDRLLVNGNNVMIVDYKTNRPPPADPADIPALYRAQMTAYRDTLAAIYPGRRIRTFLLWTDGPRMMEVTA